MIRRFIYALAVVLQLTVLAHAQDWPTKPDPALTPGKVRTDLSIEQICTTQWGSDARHVTAAMKRQVIAAYHFDVNACPLTKYRGKWVHRAEIDHLISRELGGADDVANLWPECYEPVQKDKALQDDGANKKDRLEDKLGELVCTPPNAALLKEYQAAIAKDWLELYRQFYGEH